MSSSSLVEIMEAIASQLDEQLASSVAGLQVDALAVLNPTPPCIDIYPGDPFSEAITFDSGREQTFTIRARVSTADHDAGQTLLLSLMDRNGTSVIGAIKHDPTFDDKVDDSLVEGPSGFLPYTEASGTGGALMGCVWRLKVLL